MFGNDVRDIRIRSLEGQVYELKGAMESLGRKCELCGAFRPFSDLRLVECGMGTAAYSRYLCLSCNNEIVCTTRTGSKRRR